MTGIASSRPGSGAQPSHGLVITDTVYRGEHGMRDCRSVQCRRGSISFVDNVATARVYAHCPNDVQLDRFAVDPRILCARLAIARPFIVQRDDPFVELSTIELAVGRQEAHRIALRFAEAIENTDYWKTAFHGRFAGVGELIATDPDRASDLCFEAYLLLDDIGEVEWLKAAGYDGAIHAGSGASAGDVEYKVFSSAQVRIVAVPFDPLDGHPDRRVTAITMAEAGFPDMKVSDWAGFVLPKGTPAAVRDRLHAALLAAFADPASQDRLRKATFVPVAKPLGPDEFGAFLRAEVDKWAKVVRDAKIAQD